jgi:hypothetical protein
MTKISFQQKNNACFLPQIALFPEPTLECMALVGNVDGATVGLRVGGAVGGRVTAVGYRDGAFDGGVFVGFAVGLAVGRGVGVECASRFAALFLFHCST